MSVLIKGMEMPESCLECPFKWAGDSTTYCLAQTPTMKSLMPVKLHEIRWKKFSNAVEKFRWKEASCPLVPVPPHGRLIDADEISKHKYATIPPYRKEYSDGKPKSEDEVIAFKFGWNDAIDAIVANAPTIIEAEEER